MRMIRRPANFGGFPDRARAEEFHRPRQPLARSARDDLYKVAPPSRAGPSANPISSMNFVLLRVAVTSLLLAAAPSLACAQQTVPGSVPPSSPAPSPAATAPLATGASPAPASTDTVGHIRQLVRDVQSNTDNIKSQGDFGAQLWLVQGQEFFQDWVKPATPNITPVTIVPRGENIYTAIIFYGITHDAAGLANVSYDITVHRPDGSIYSQYKTLIGWQGLAPQQTQTLELGRDHIAVNITESDPAGLYTVDAVVRDNVSRIELPLKQTFVVE
jgi:hypothetical protein